MKKYSSTASYVLLAAACVCFMVVCQMYGTRNYVSWPDESWFMEIALSLRDTGQLAAPSLTDAGMGMGQKFVAMPPVYPLSLAGWYAVTSSESLESGRIFCNLLGIAVIVLLFLIMRRMLSNPIWAGIAVLGLAVDVQFVTCANFVRPEILSLVLAYLALLLYIRSYQARERIHAGWFCGAMASATLGMLTHPISAAMGFFVIPVHFVLMRHDRRRLALWIAMALIPLIGVSLWGIYALSDFEIFRSQFIDWEMGRKAGRFTSLKDVLLIFWRSILNYGVKGITNRKIASVSTLLVVGLCAHAFREEHRENIVLLIGVTMMSAFSYHFGREMMYPPLRLPSFFWGLGILMADIADRRLLQPRLWFPRIRGDWVGWRVYVAGVFSLLFALVAVRSTMGTLRIAKEIRMGTRSEAYDRKALASGIIDAVPAGSSLGFRLFPDCLDVLSSSGHFSKISRLGWAVGNEKEQAERVRANEYLVITDSYFDPRSPGHLTDLTQPWWGCLLERKVAALDYEPVARITIGGTNAVTVVYRRRPPSSSL